MEQHRLTSHGSGEAQMHGFMPCKKPATDFQQLGPDNPSYAFSDNLEIMHTISKIAGLKNNPALTQLLGHYETEHI